MWTNSIFIHHRTHTLVMLRLFFGWWLCLTCERRKMVAYDGVPQQQQKSFQGFSRSDFFLSIPLSRARCAAHIFNCGFRHSLADFPINFHATLECHSVVFEGISSSSVFSSFFFFFSWCHKTFFAFLVSLFSRL